jgi:hypothetical protein
MMMGQVESTRRENKTLAKIIAVVVVVKAQHRIVVVRIRAVGPANSVTLSHHVLHPWLRETFYSKLLCVFFFAPVFVVFTAVK